MIAPLQTAKQMGSTRSQRWAPQAPALFDLHIHLGITDSEFRAFQQLIHREAGIHLGSHKKALLVGRLNRRLRALGLSSMHDYYQYLQQSGDLQERQRMLDCISTNETQFFREPAQFRFLQTQVYPRWQAEAEAGRRRRTIRVWSAACSTGEEPYSVAMTLLQHFPPERQFAPEILASDICTEVLAKARAGRWPVDKAGSIPRELLKKFMLRGVGSQQGVMAAGPELRSIIRFQRLNLHSDRYPDEGFDLIFCRNVLIYFSEAAKAKVVERLLARLNPGGYLLLGHAESLRAAEKVVRHMPAVYSLPEAGQ